MIIKSKSGKSKRALANTLRYILAKDNPKDIGFVLNRFIKGDRPLEALMENAEANLENQLINLEKRVGNMVGQFMKNEDKRLIKRQNANLFYHEIISFHQKDAEQLPKKVLMKIVRKYAKVRAPNSLVVSAMHKDKDHLHIHQVISALEYATGKPLHLNRNEFKQVKKRMEQWQDQELKLEHSKVNHDKRSLKLAELDIERHLNLMGKQSERQQIAQKVMELYAEAKSEKSFYLKLEKAGLRPYQRGGKIVGVMGTKRKYRLKTLGYSAERIAKEKRKQHSRLQSLERLKATKNKDLELGR